MWETLQISYNGETYQFQIIKFNQLPVKFEFQILLQGVTMTLCKAPQGDWELKHESKIISCDLVKMIGKMLSGKYRLSFDQPEPAKVAAQHTAIAVN